jgi:hypothetical protein
MEYDILVDFSPTDWAHQRVLMNGSSGWLWPHHVSIRDIVTGIKILEVISR